ncbi:hypothetical protein AVEN_223604-1 [Araneus ventricosus]|uniref:Uncharacterized protein n=1 Tax=Araneus ventricosus TaxID=182803 RepID=A0A4Y2P751_ARAVE|nr:hypothetical protein AVEN_223604-1 [Araneus ventricosus]
MSKQVAFCCLKSTLLGSPCVHVHFVRKLEYRLLSKADTVTVKVSCDWKGGRPLVAPKERGGGRGKKLNDATENLENRGTFIPPPLHPPNCCSIIWDLPDSAILPLCGE